jgi:hypothetical protein
MKKILFTFLGVITASVLAWGGLLGWAALVLNPDDSYFDRNPAALDTFVVAWGALSLLGGIVGWWVGGKLGKGARSAAAR